MRGSLLVYCGAISLGAAASVVGCSESESEASLDPSPDSGGSEAAVDDGGAIEPDAEDDAEAGASQCSIAGWCRTTLPDEDLILKDIWPVSGHAFAIADSPTIGVKILEWNDAEGTWRYIDDGTQNAVGFGSYAGGIWAPNEDEVYCGVAPGYIYHGKRPVPPAMAWSWTRHKLEDSSRVGSVDPLDGYPYYSAVNARYPALGVWGTSPDDVHAWFADTIYHRTSIDGGAPEWVPEYTADDPSTSTERLFFVAAAGRSPDDIWFSGARARTESECALLVRKTSEGYQKIADGVLAGEYSNCTERPGSLLIGGVRGWLTDIHAVSGDGLIGLKGARDVVGISRGGDSYSVTIVPTPRQIAAKPVNSIWVASDELWLSGWGLVLRGNDAIWDGGAYEVSSVSLNGAPLNRPLYQIRGTSNKNLWAIGVRNALHKTTP